VLTLTLDVCVLVCVLELTLDVCVLVFWLELTLDVCVLVYGMVAVDLLPLKIASQEYSTD
jgi:hypothetical protein